MMQTSFIVQAIQAIHQDVLKHEADIEKLDRELGDGDHYINLKRGCQALLNLSDELAQLPIQQALQKMGMTLLGAVGGASGPLFASFFISMAKTLPNSANLVDIAHSFVQAVDAIAQRGKSGLGEKTMLDVLIPVAQHFQKMASAGQSAEQIALQLPQIAYLGLESTRPLLASKGRAAGLGERAIGHLDAGAKSCEVMIKSVCNLVTSHQNGTPQNSK